MSQPIPERVLLITGASSGIGAATARLAAQAGYRLVLAARARESLQALADELGGSARALAVACDIASFAEQQALIAATLAHFGQIDLVFANAGFIKGATSYVDEALTPDDWREMVVANVYGTAITARLALPELLKTKGHLLLTGSVAGRVALPGELYSATKWAITGMGESIRREVTGRGVRVTVIEPGRVATAFWKGPTDPAQPAPVLLTPVDVARAVLYAISQPPHVDVNEILLRPVGQDV